MHDIKFLMSQQNTCIAHVRQNCNIVSHTLANGRSSGRTAVWLCSGPENIVELCKSESSYAT